MEVKIVEKILDIGYEAAYSKMTLSRNLKKPDMRTSNFSYLWSCLLHEVVNELRIEIDKIIILKEKNPLYTNFSYEDLLKATYDEAGDVIAFASGIAAKCKEEIEKINNKQNSLFDE